MLIREARVPDELPVVRALLEEYAAGLDVDLCFQDFAGELAGLPGRYASPLGGLWLAIDDCGTAVGCVASRPLGEGRCEIKRLYLRQGARGIGAGRRLVEAALAHAAAIGHERVCLDTLPVMNEAIALYRSLGFVEVAPYHDSPIAGMLFLERSLIGPFIRVP